MIINFRGQLNSKDYYLKRFFSRVMNIVNTRVLVTFCLLFLSGRKFVLAQIYFFAV